MVTLRTLSSRFTGLLREMTKFGVVGVAGVGVNFLVFNVLRGAGGLPTVRSSVIATGVSIAFNYVGFRYYTYRTYAKDHRGREMTLFAAFSVAGAAIENGVLYAAVHGLGWDGPAAGNALKFTGIAVATVFRFWAYRTWVFHRAIEVKSCPAPLPPSFSVNSRDGGSARASSSTATQGEE
ncbi:GtrA family protein [Streptomyces sp. ICBB 8177]|uniref:GtrA family protein n=1 Tax=Streptomyces sp. ICBB 8177 TaxID=563922 RepID=UPI000D674326|nr:GtrA family protein [Streptomyces sp. ICBB 8177]PWI45076.1 hypothetical protein CK485_07875 [Streptomyces sp. ICBB 8177]